MTTSPSELIVERNKTHGSFQFNAKISQELKHVIQKNLAMQGLDLSMVQQEALDMICLKISRICSGQADYADHWADIAGYAKLAEQGGMAVPQDGKAISPRPNPANILVGNGIFSDENEL